MNILVFYTILKEIWLYVLWIRFSLAIRINTLSIVDSIMRYFLFGKSELICGVWFSFLANILLVEWEKLEYGIYVSLHFVFGFLCIDVV